MKVGVSKKIMRPYVELLNIFSEIAHNRNENAILLDLVRVNGNPSNIFLRSWGPLPMTLVI